MAQKHGSSGFAGLKLSIRLSPFAAMVTHSWPSGPEVMSLSVSLPDSPAWNSSWLPSGFMRTSFFVPLAMNQRLPSEPAVIAVGFVPPGSGCSSIVPSAGSTRTIASE